jgi:hypothetical protein
MDTEERFMDQMIFAFIILPCFVLRNKAIGHTYCRGYGFLALESNAKLVFHWFIALSASNFSHRDRSHELENCSLSRLVLFILWSNAK